MTENQQDDTGDGILPPLSERRRRALEQLEASADDKGNTVSSAFVNAAGLKGFGAASLARNLPAVDLAKMMSDSTGDLRRRALDMVEASRTAYEPPDFSEMDREIQEAMEEVRHARAERQEREDALQERQAATLELIAATLDAEQRERGESERRDSRRQAITTAVAFTMPVLAILLARPTGWWAALTMAGTIVLAGLVSWLAWPRAGGDR